MLAVRDMTDLLDLMRAAATIRPVDRDGSVIQSGVHEVLSLTRARSAMYLAEIELHEDRASGLWMWSTSWNTGASGQTYRVGPKWGKFADTREDALHWACVELRDRLARETGKEVSDILKWLGGLA
jgi:hypothetical protein